MADETSLDPAARTIEDVFSLWTQARRKRDLRGLMALLEDTVVFAATDSVHIGRERTAEDLARDFERVDNLDVRFGLPHTVELGDLAWSFRHFTSEIKAKGKTSQVSGRLTVLLRRGADGWRIAHWHASVPRTSAPD